MFRSVPSSPDFDIIVNNDIGFSGADEYGFASHNNEAEGLLPTPALGLDIDWLAQELFAEPFDSVDLPTVPPDLGLLGGGLLAIVGDCLICAGPASFFRIEGTLTSLTLASEPVPLLPPPAPLALAALLLCAGLWLIRSTRPASVRLRR